MSRNRFYPSPAEVKALRELTGHSLPSCRGALIWYRMQAELDAGVDSDPVAATQLLHEVLQVLIREKMYPGAGMEDRIKKMLEGD